MSKIEDNKRIARRWFDLATQGRVEELCAMTALTWILWAGRCTRFGATPTILVGCSSSGRGLSQPGPPRNLFGYLRRSH